MDKFIERPIKDRLYLLIIALFNEPAISAADKQTIFLEVLAASGLHGKNSYYDAELRNDKIAPSVSIKKRYFPRLGSYLEGGPPYLHMECRQIKNDVLLSEIKQAISSDLA